MTKEQVYEQQLKDLGIFEEAFRPEISTLAQLERELTRAKKAWSATVPRGDKPSMLDPLYRVIIGLRQEILAHREALGLTPKALRRLRGATGTALSEQDLITQRLDIIAQRVQDYEAGVSVEDLDGSYAAVTEPGAWKALADVFDPDTDGGEGA